jgi:hypothetical protein
MTTPKIDDKLKQSATLWQLIFGIGSTLVTVVAFILFMKADVSAAIKDNERQDKMLEMLEQKMTKQSDKSDLNQKEILEKLNKIELQIKDKQDRKNY